VADAMKVRGWLVQPQLGGLGSPVNLHLTISAGHLAVADRFLADLRTSVAEAQAAGPEPGLDLLMQAVSGIDFSQLSEEGFREALALAGIRGTALPDKLATINTLLDALPVPAREAALLAFLNDLYTAHAGSLEGQAHSSK